MYSIKHMQTFCAVVEYGGFVGAESVLGMSQPAISTHIRDFEVRLGFSICHRGRSGFGLTEKGEVVYRRCREMLNSFSDLEAELGSLRNMLTGTLRVGLVDNTITNTEVPIPDAIHRFFERSSQVSLRLAVLPPEELERELLNGNLHLAVGPFQKRHPALNYQPLYTEEHRFYCGRRHPLYGVEPTELSLERVGSYPISSRTYVQQAEIPLIRPYLGAAFVSNMEAQAMLIRSGRFLGFLPVHFAASWVASGEMKELALPELRWHSEFCLAMRATPAPQEVVRVFVDDLVSSLGLRVGGR
ncbi:LysR family transcriptional regulator [Oceanimonas sp. CHS3-5]|uniref:LysR family transcriptional regulator n=1 Tax=Oceanimonas sp. CHS3-5 TaxID=3068186 RepID=UPI00273EF07B|nr:LysR family transcriptional regulator [Oceanimonas sp. CHS3-5]MDP5293199.1 LysR family transcriptional regulator [Oceanimonas sp. CHS3-5]